MLCVGGSAIPLGWSFLSIAKVPMSWEPEDRWVVEFELPAGSRLEYKYVILEEQDWTQQVNATTEGTMDYSYRVHLEVTPPDVQKITRKMAIVAWQSGPNRVLHVPDEVDIDRAMGGIGDVVSNSSGSSSSGPGKALYREFEASVGGEGSLWSPVDMASVETDAHAGNDGLCREFLYADEDGRPMLDRRDVWGTGGTSPYR